MCIEDLRHSISQVEKLRPEQVYVLFRQLTAEKLLEPFSVPIKMLFLPLTSNKGFVTSCKNKIVLNFHYSNKKKIHAIVGIRWLQGQADELEHSSDTYQSSSTSLSLSELVKWSRKLFIPQRSVVKMHTQDFAPDMACSNYLMNGDYLTLPLTANLPKEGNANPPRKRKHA